MNEETRPHGAMTLGEWAQSQRSDLVVTSKSEPEPVMLAHNLVAVLDDIEEAREIVRKWERIQTAEAGVGFVAMGRPETASPPVARAVRRHDSGTPKTDPEKVTSHTGRRVLRGAIPGAVIGALVVGVIVAIGEPGLGPIIGAALAGAAFGFVAGGVASYVAGTGWSEAYKETFVEPEMYEVVFASIHSDDAGVIEQAAGATSEAGRFVSVDRNGQRT